MEIVAMIYGTVAAVGGSVWFYFNTGNRSH